MKNLTLLSLMTLVIAFAIGCSKDESVNTNNLQTRSLYPQNPLPPQVVISSPIRGDRGEITTPISVGDTFSIKFYGEAGRTWWGGPTRLSKYRVVFNNKIWEEVPVKGKSYSGSTLIVVDSPGTYGIGVSFWQEDGNVGSQGFYVIN